MRIWSRTILQKRGTSGAKGVQPGPESGDPDFDQILPGKLQSRSRSRLKFFGQTLIENRLPVEVLRRKTRIVAAEDQLNFLQANPD